MILMHTQFAEYKAQGNHVVSLIIYVSRINVIYCLQIIIQRQLRLRPVSERFVSFKFFCY